MLAKMILFSGCENKYVHTEHNKRAFKTSDPMKKEKITAEQST
jgi:hypothetical protein